MTFGYLGIGLVLLIGVAVVAYGWLADRTDTKRRQASLTSPPDRPIPSLGPDAPTPDYRTEDQLLHRPARERAPEMPDDLRDRLRTAPTLALGHAADEFANASLTEAQPASRPVGLDKLYQLCVLPDPRILVTDAAITSIRELLDFLADAQHDGVPVVIAAAGVTDEVLATLRVNTVQNKVGVAAVLAPDAVQRSQLASMVGAKQLSLADLRSGYLPADAFGTCGVWVSSRTRSWVVA